MAIQPDGKIVAAGGAGVSFFIARFGTNGAIDASFGSGGFVFPIPGNNRSAVTLTLLPNGSIVSGGYVGCGSGSMCIVVVRLMVDGSPDATFANNGVLETDLAGFGRAVAVDNQGRVVIGGARCLPFNGPCNLTVARFLADGAPDPSFGSGGEAQTSATSSSQIGALQIQPDGKIILAGDDASDMLLARYDTSGALDLSFNSTGTARLVFAPAAVVVETGLAVQADEKILVWGMGAGASRPLPRARRLADGTPDAYFATNGQEVAPNPGYFTFGPFLDAQGRALACGDMQDPPVYDYTFAVTRYDYDGALDATFGIDGHIRWGVEAGQFDDCYSLVIQPDGKIVLAGVSANFNPTLIRLKPQP